jgi:serine/threonine protein phosphatase PrpC/CRP-like cAMP-binding protein
MALAEELHWFAATDVGRRRSHNEDSFLADENLGLFIVADGMGGHAAGEIASEIAVRTIHEVVAAQKDTVSERAMRGPRSEVSHNQLLGLLEYAIQEASARIHNEAKRDKRKRGMGTTISLLLVAGSYGYVAHVGDSRIYLLRNGSVQQITEDHTVANELIRLGMVTPDQLVNVPRRNAITRAVGVYQHAEVDTLTLEMLPSDQFLLSSDGLSAYFADPEDDLPKLLADKDGERTVRALIDFANERGGKDNITAILVRLGTGDVADTARARRVQLKREVLAQLPLFARLNERELLRVMQVAEVHQYEEGDVIMTEGERGDHMFVSLQGRLEVSRGLTVMSQIGPGEQLGEMALIRSTPRSATVTALEPSELISLNRRDFFEIIRTEPHLAVKLLWQFLGVLAARLEDTTRLLSDAREQPPTEELSTQPPIDSEDRPTPVPDDPFAQPSFGLGRLPLRLSSVPTPLEMSLDDTLGEQRIEDSPSFDDAPALAQRLPDVPLWETSDPAIRVEEPSWDSWDSIGDGDPETRRRIEHLARQLEQDAENIRKTKPSAPIVERGRSYTQPMVTAREPGRLRRPDPSTEELDVSPPQRASRRRHKTLQSAGSSPPQDSTPGHEQKPAEQSRPSAPEVPNRRAKATMPDGRMRAVRTDPLAKTPATTPLDTDSSEGEEPFRPTKQTLPVQPDETLKHELEALRAEFKQRLDKSRAERSRKGGKDSD